MKRAIIGKEDRHKSTASSTTVAATVGVQPSFPFTEISHPPMKRPRCFLPFCVGGEPRPEGLENEVDGLSFSRPPGCEQPRDDIAIQEAHWNTMLLRSAKGLSTADYSLAELFARGRDQERTGSCPRRDPRSVRTLDC
jgi:hypothetical protein